MGGSDVASDLLSKGLGASRQGSLAAFHLHYAERQRNEHLVNIA